MTLLSPHDIHLLLNHHQKSSRSRPFSSSPISPIGPYSSATRPGSTSRRNKSLPPAMAAGGATICEPGTTVVRFSHGKQGYRIKQFVSSRTSVSPSRPPRKCTATAAIGSSKRSIRRRFMVIFDTTSSVLWLLQRFPKK